MEISCASASLLACRRQARAEGQLAAAATCHSLLCTLRAMSRLAGITQHKRLEQAPCISTLHPAGNRDKKLAALDIVNVSIKIYFRLNTLRLCKNLMRTVDSRQFAPFDAFPMSQRVTYKFYVGRLAVFDEKYVRTPRLERRHSCVVVAGTVVLTALLVPGVDALLAEVVRLHARH